MHDAICISDVHLGAANCRARELHHFLKELRTKTLVINGDLFDSLDFRRLNKHHWKILADLRHISSHTEVIWVRGNHDEAPEIISHFIGATVVDHYILETGGKKILFTHGDKFDKFITDHPIITNIADWFYILLQKIDSSCYFAKLAKRSSKTFLRCVEAIEEGTYEMMGYLKCDFGITGHSHHPYIGNRYANAGSWTELPCSFLTIDEGVVDLCHFPSESN
jgi:UDP-2,3-diacylglucosamine pyrophosphatase LpxH